MDSDLIRKSDVTNILKSLQDKKHNPCAYAELEVARNKICELPTVEVIDVHSEIDINNEVLSVSKPPESSIKNMLARNLVEELEKYITVKKHPGMFHNTVFHARVDLVMWKGEKMARLIDAELLLEDNTWEWFDEWGNYTSAGQAIADAPTVDAVEVVHGEWKHFENGIAYCSECGVYAVEDGTYYCPHCGADMRVGRWKGEGMGDFSCSLCGEVVSGNHREKCPNCHAKMDGGDKA